MAHPENDEENDEAVFRATIAAQEELLARYHGFGPATCTGFAEHVDLLERVHVAEDHGTSLQGALEGLHAQILAALDELDNGRPSFAAQILRGAVAPTNVLEAV